MLTAYTARYIFPITTAPIENGVVVVENGRIVHVGREVPTGATVVDLNDKNNLTSGGVAMLPGLINAHTHLEFSDLESPLGEAGMSFPDWIRAVIGHRNTAPLGGQQDRGLAVALGLSQCEDFGTATIGEIATDNWPWQMLHDEAFAQRVEGPQVTLFYEMLGLADDRTADVDEKLTRLHNLVEKASPRWQLGVSPHAPYSTHWKLVEALGNYSQRHSMPLAMHLAESREELDLLQTHAGPFRELLDDLGVWNPSAIPHGSRPLVYLQQLAKAHRSLVIHGNYLDEEEIQFIANHRQQMSIIYCPRTHAYFQHDAYPLEKMLAAGVNVALGTDSRASNPDLSLLAETRYVAAHFPNLPGEAVLRLGTINGAKALGLDNEFGSLENGKRAHFAVVALPNRAGEPTEILLASELPCVATSL